MRHRFKLVLLALPICVAVGAEVGCSSADDATTTQAGGAGASTPTGGSGGTGDGGGAEGGSGGAGGMEPCASAESEASLESTPVDVILAVGNNGSMSQEIASVEENINASFGSILAASGVDYRMVVVSRSGAHQFNICIEEPLSATALGDCATKTNNASPDNNPPTFFHYSLEVKANDSWCKLLGGFDGSAPDEYGLAPTGYQEWLRPEATKIFVLLSDSSVNCTYNAVDLDDGSQSPSIDDLPVGVAAATAFDEQLLLLSPEQFGTADSRKYQFYSLVGLENKEALDPTVPWLPTDPVSINKCSSQVVSPAIGYQSLSVLSGGLRFPICAYDDFDVIFEQIAQGIIAGAAAECDLEIPEPPPGQVVDPETLSVEFTPADGGPVETYDQVDGPADCVDGAFYVDGNHIRLCPDTCAHVQDGQSGKLVIGYDCKFEGPA